MSYTQSYPLQKKIQVTARVTPAVQKALRIWAIESGYPDTSKYIAALLIDDLAKNNRLPALEQP